MGTLFDTCFLVKPPAGPFLSGQKGAKEPVKAGDADFPRLNNPPLETAKKGELRFPLLGTSPRLLRWRLSGGGGLRCNAPAAPACMGENWGMVLERRGGLYGRPQAIARAASTLLRVGADAPGRPLLPLWGNSPSAHIGPPYSRLKRLPCYPF